MTTPEADIDELLQQAKDARRRSDEQTSTELLRAYLQRGRALLWLAKMTSDTQEALAAAELAFCLKPDDEVTQRALVAARERAAEVTPQAPQQDKLSVAVALTTGMTLREARAVIWPYNNINLPIGDALDAGRIRLRDLGWALERKTGRIQTAARTVLFAQVAGQAPATPPRPLRVIAGSRYTEYQERRALIFAIFAAAAAFVVSVALIATGIVSWWYKIGLLSTIVLVVLGPLGHYLLRLMNRLDEQSSSYRLGRWGEERIVEHLRALLDDRWTLFRNFTWPNRRGGDIDMVLVGPGGVWAFEIKTYSGDVRNIGDRWERRGKRGWYKLYRHPGKQARYNAVRLKTFLAEQRIACGYVEPAVIWASAPTEDADVVGTLAVERPKTPVWTTDALPDRIERMIQEDPLLAPDTADQIVELLRTTLEESLRQERGRQRASRPHQSLTKSS